MGLSKIEVGRLAIMQRSPARYVERRVEHLDLSDDYHYGVTVTQQVAVPSHGSSSETADLLVPLGQFSKDQMPNLRVTSPDGTVLPLLKREERKQLGASLFNARWHDRFFAGIAGEARDEALALWHGEMYFTVGEIVVNSKEAAEEQVDELKEHLIEQSEAAPSDELRAFPLTVLEEDEFWRDLRSLAKTRLLVAKMRGEPERTYVVTVQYTERFHYRDYAKTTLNGLIRKGLAWLGLIGMPTARAVANLGQAASLWIVQLVPEGAEALRYYWRREGRDTRPLEPTAVERTRAVASRRYERDDPVENDLLLLDAQISPSSAIAATIALAALLLVVSTYVFQALPELRNQTSSEDRAILVALGSIFAAVPAGIAGALAYRGQTFVRHASRGPRVLLAILSGQAAFFAAVVSLKNLDDLSEAVAYILSIYSLIVIGIFSFIQLGPRWRKNERSRRQTATKKTSPVACRRNQILQALAFLLCWAVIVVGFARTQAVLQHDHFFSPDFPGNVWSAWWSWFDFMPYEHLGSVECRPSIC